MNKKEIKIGNIERRTFTGKVEIRDAANDSRKIFGYAAKFNVETELFPGVSEIILPGFFDSVLEDDVRALKNHDSNFILGRTAAKTLQIGIDETGLWYALEMPDRSHANDLLDEIRTGDITQSSFGFTIEEQEEQKIVNEKDNTVKFLIKLKKARQLFDVSPVTFPAYQTTEVGLRSIEKLQNEENNNQKPVLKNLFTDMIAIQIAARRRKFSLLKLR